MDSTSAAYQSVATYDDGSCPVIFSGCTSSLAINYRSIATRDDGTCQFAGCRDSHALNYNPSATLAAECVTPVLGCTASAATNYFSAANLDDSTCIFAGCTDSTRLNYDVVANIESGLCIPWFYGCTTATIDGVSATNYNAVYTRDDGTCSFPGCTDSTKANFRPFATFDDFTCSARRRGEQVQQPPGEMRLLTSLEHLSHRRLSLGCLDPQASNYDDTASRHKHAACEYRVLGCTDSAALNYLSAAEQERSPSDCIYPIRGCTVQTGTLNFDSAAQVLSGCVFVRKGCTDSIASNFVAAANTDDGSCTYELFGCTAPTAINFDSLATTMGSDTCTFAVVGCMDKKAMNFATDANVACSGCCKYVQRGCMSAVSMNYDSMANQDDGSCVISSPPPSPPPPAPPLTPPPEVPPSPQSPALLSQSTFPPYLPGAAAAPPPFESPRLLPLPQTPPSSPRPPPPILPLKPGESLFFVLNVVFTVAGDVSSFDATGFRESLHRVFANASHVSLTLTQASVRLNARLRYDSLAGAMSAHTTLMNTPISTMQSAWFGELYGGAGVILASAPSATVSRIVLPAVSPSSPLAEVLPPASAVPALPPPPPPPAVLVPSNEDSRLNTRLMECMNRSELLPIAITLMSCAVLGVIIGAYRDTVAVRHAQFKRESAQSDHTEVRTHSPKPVKCSPGGGITLFRRKVMVLHTLISTAHEGWLGLSRAQSVQIVMSSAAIEVALACLLGAHGVPTSPVDYVGNSIISVMAIGCLTSILTTMAAPLLMIYFSPDLALRFLACCPYILWSACCPRATRPAVRRSKPAKVASRGGDVWKRALYVVEKANSFKNSSFKASLAFTAKAGAAISGGYHSRVPPSTGGVDDGARLSTQRSRVPAPKAQVADSLDDIELEENFHNRSKHATTSFKRELGLRVRGSSNTSSRGDAPSALDLANDQVRSSAPGPSVQPASPTVVPPVRGKLPSNASEVPAPAASPASIRGASVLAAASSGCAAIRHSSLDRRGAQLDKGAIILNSSPSHTAQDHTRTIAKAQGVRGTFVWMRALSWALSWMALFGLCTFITLSGCSLGEPQMPLTKDLCFTWLWSAGQRWLVNEPMIILLTPGDLLFSMRARKSKRRSEALAGGSFSVHIPRRCIVHVYESD